MSAGYTPGLQLAESTTVAKLRELPLPGEVLVRVGDRVRADTPVLVAELPGELDVLRIAERTGLEPNLVGELLSVKAGDQIRRDQLLIEKRFFFGLFATRFISPVSGTVEYFTPINAHMGVRGPAQQLKVNAYVDGVVTKIDPTKAVEIETHGAYVQGIFGVGGERRGAVCPLSIGDSDVVSLQDIKAIGDDLTGKVLIGGSAVELAALRELAERGIAALITGSIDSQTLSAFVGYEIGVSMTGDEDLPFTMIITEGFGRLPLSSAISKLARKFAGAPCSVNGATQVRAGALRPELIINHSLSVQPSVETRSNNLEEGTRIRCIRAPYFGMIGTVKNLPPQPTQIASGAEVRVLTAVLEGGELVVIPRANVELANG